MMSSFDDFVEDSMEVFMDDFSMFNDSFDLCPNNVEWVLEHCEEANLVINWEKYHLMV